MSGRNPLGAGQRMLTVLALLWITAWVMHQIAVWLTPLIPLTIAIGLLAIVWALVFGRWRR